MTATQTAKPTAPKPTAPRKPRAPRKAAPAKTGNPAADRAKNAEAAHDSETANAEVAETEAIEAARVKADATPEPAPKPDPKPNKSDAKTDLGRRAVLALGAMFAGLDDSDLALAGWTREEAAQCLANWVHHFPVGRDDKGRTWPATTLPKPDRSDWL